MDRTQIVIWMRRYLAEKLETDVANIEEETSFDSFGLDSVVRANMIADLGDVLGLEIDPSMGYDYASVSEFADEIVVQLPSGHHAVGVAISTDSAAPSANVD